MKNSWTHHMPTLQAVLAAAISSGMDAPTFLSTYRAEAEDTVHSAHAVSEQVRDVSRILHMTVTAEFMSTLRAIAAEEAGGPVRTPRGPRVPRQPVKRTFTREEVAALFGQDDPRWVSQNRERLGLEVVMLKATALRPLDFVYTVPSVEAALARETAHAQSMAA